MKLGSSSQALLIPTTSTSCRPLIIRFESTGSGSTSSTSSSSWSRALPPGTNAAYDAALDYLSEQQSQALASLTRLRALSNPSASIMKRIDKLEVEAHVNDPAIRQRFRESKGRGMMGQPVMRHLAERRWKKDGGLDLVMGRVYQNKVVPDLLPDVGPTSPLSVTLDSTLMEPGIPLEPSKLNDPPKITFQPFTHPSQPTSSEPLPTGLYSLLLVDPDTPSAETQSFSQRLHYLKSDIPLSILTGETDLASDIGRTLVPWEPPAPERGSGRHRYVFILLQQSSSSSSTSPLRENFDFRTYLTENGFTSSSIVGINLFRSTWSSEQADFIDSVFREHRRLPEGAPVYGKPPKEMKYGYPTSGIERRAGVIRQQAWEKAVENMDVEIVEETEDGNKMPA